MTSQTVFISYSQADEAEKDKLLVHLQVLQNTPGLIDIWSDKRIGPGKIWKEELEQALDQARIAILFISASFLTTDFIMKQTVPAMLKLHENAGLVVFPIIAKACAWEKVDWLNKMSVRPRDRQPIWGRSRHVDQELALIAEEIATIVSQPAPSKSTQRSRLETEELYQPVKPPNTARLRRLLSNAFDDTGLEAFCQDHFYEVYRNFSRGLRKDEKITALLDHCHRTPGGFEKLLEAARTEASEDSALQETLKPLLKELEQMVG